MEICGLRSLAKKNTDQIVSYRQYIDCIFSVFFFFLNEKLENTVFYNVPLLNSFPTQIF